MSQTDFIDLYLAQVGSVAEHISRSDIASFVELLHDAWRQERQIFIAGNGGSASTATHFAADLNKFASEGGPKRFRAIALTDNVATVTAITNDLGWENLYVEQLKNFMRSGDLLIVISVHGGSGSDQAGLWSQNLLKAAKFVQDNDGRVLGLAGFDGGAFKRMADACVVVPANSTPQVEGFHSVLTHLICARLRELIAQT